MRLPVLMYHSVNPGGGGWRYPHLTISPSTFDAQLRYLSVAGFRTVFLDEVYACKRGVVSLDKMVALTFDDGYLDNWVFVFPLLRKYGMKATIFVSTDFVARTGNQLRPQSDQVGDKAPLHKGYLSWAEMRVMESSGLIDIQSHTRTHTWLFQNDQVVDFHHPGDGELPGMPYEWLTWNAMPKMKSRSLEMDGKTLERLVDYGLPIFSFDRALVGRQYFPDSSICKHLVSFVEEEGADFFSRDDWRSRLFGVYEQYVAANGIGGWYETEQEYLDRIRDELFGSKAILEKALNKRVDFLCWPGGAYTTEALSIAQEAYRATTAKGSPNIPGEDPTRIERISFRQFKRAHAGLDVLAVANFILKLRSYSEDAAIGRVWRMLRKTWRRLAREG